MEDFPLIAGFSYVHFGSVEGHFHLNKTPDTAFIRMLRSPGNYSFIISEYGPREWW